MYMCTYMYIHAHVHTCTYMYMYMWGNGSTFPVVSCLTLIASLMTYLELKKGSQYYIHVHVL